MGETKIEWTDKVWQDKTAANRLGISLEEYLSLRSQGLKHCGRCRQWRSMKKFGADASRGDGHAPVCLDCRRTGSTIKFLALSEEDAKRQRYNRWYQNGGAPSVRARVYARKRDTEPISPDLRNQLMGEFSGRCAYCGAIAAGIDHIVPVVMGGCARRGNLLPACKSCNSSKNDRDVFDWLRSRGSEIPMAVIDAISLAEANGYGYY